MNIEGEKEGEGKRMGGREDHEKAVEGVKI